MESETKCCLWVTVSCLLLSVVLFVLVPGKVVALMRASMFGRWRTGDKLA